MTAPAPEPVIARPPVWGAYLLAVALLAVLIISARIVLRACGVTVLGTTITFPWCPQPPHSYAEFHAEEARRDSLQNQIRTLEIALLDPATCGPRGAPPPPPPPPPEPEPEPQPEERAETPPPPAPPVVQVAVCAPNQVVAQPSEVALGLDSSGSMQFAIDTPPGAERELDRLSEELQGIQSRVLNNPLAMLQSLARIQQLQQRIQQAEARLRGAPGADRMTGARRVLTEAVRQAPDGMGMSLTAFNQCQPAQMGRYASGQRGALIQRLNRVQAGGPTPLAAAMAQAARTLSGGQSPDDPVNMVVVTDGRDSCGGAPCAVARQLKRQRPGLIINVIDLSNNNELRCVAASTGGTYRTREGRDFAELSRAVREASGIEGAGRCRDVAQ